MKEEKKIEEREQFIAWRNKKAEYGETMKIRIQRITIGK